MRLIDADTVVTIPVYDDMLETIDTKKMSIADAIDEWSDEGCPSAVDAEPVKHGRWIKRSTVYSDFPYDSIYNYLCSNCGYWHTHSADVEVPYCWHCGAKMDKGDEI